jgi:fructan beta-fructosidase
VDETGETKWVLLVSINPGAPLGGSATQYFVGDFDGQTFALDRSFTASVQNGEAVWLDHGRDNYAGVTWSDVPGEDGRRLFLGWMGNWEYAQVVPTTAWRSAMTLPRELTLGKTGEGYRVFSRPVRELQSLRTVSKPIQAAEIPPARDLTAETGISPAAMELILEFEPAAGSAADFGVELSNARGERYRIGYDHGARRFYSDRRGAGDHAFSDRFAAAIHPAPRLSQNPTVRFHLFFDVASAELFADGGATAVTDIFFPGEPFAKASLYAEKGKVKLIRGEAHALKSIWR